MNAFLNMVLSSIQSASFSHVELIPFEIHCILGECLITETCVKQLRLKCSLGSNPCICPFVSFIYDKKNNPQPMCQFTKLEVDINDKLMVFIS